MAIGKIGRPFTPPDVRYRSYLAAPDSNGCILWTGTIHKSSGYGVFTLWDQESQRRRNVQAHRFGWELHHGFPPGNCVMHLCDVRLCQAISHLLDGDHVANMADMVTKDRQARGVTVARSRLTPDLVRLIRSEYATGISQDRLALKYGLGQTTISGVIRRRTWRHVD